MWTSKAHSGRQVHGAQVGSYEGLEGLGSARGLTHLYLQNNGLESLAGVGALPGLQKLYADGNRLAEVAGLKGCGQLEELHVSGQRLGASPGAAVHFDYACMAALGRSLQVLAVQGCGLGDGHVGVFGLLPRLERLDPGVGLLLEQPLHLPDLLLEPLHRL